MEMETPMQGTLDGRVRVGLSELPQPFLKGKALGGGLGVKVCRPATLQERSSIALVFSSVIS